MRPMRWVNSELTLAESPSFGFSDGMFGLALQELAVEVVLEPARNRVTVNLYLAMVFRKKKAGRISCFLM